MKATWPIFSFWNPNFRPHPLPIPPYLPLFGISLWNLCSTRAEKPAETRPELQSQFRPRELQCFRVNKQAWVLMGTLRRFVGTCTRIALRTKTSESLGIYGNPKGITWELPFLFLPLMIRDSAWLGIPADTWHPFPGIVTIRIRHSAM